ncbi:GntR family transcriptional regulator [Streptacidiphilus albus]|uniref:GntR family transcriptional regulator n=2 Tax=Streptacidiphilus albus TaxID=105425 RepID=UPI0009E00BA4|nr:GntR family transcriptional regulator [Streptacidiphilus albus]
MSDMHCPQRHAFERVAQNLSRRITQGQFPPGRNLPSERELARQFQVNRLTVRAALDRLADQGLVRGDRMGTYPLPPGGAEGEPEPKAPVRPAPAFPGVVIDPDESAVATSWLQQHSLEPEESALLAARPGEASLVYHEQLLGHQGRVLQTSRTCLAPDLVRLVPQLGRLRTALHGLGGRGIPASLQDLPRWAARARVLLQPVPVGAGGAAARSLRDQYGRIQTHTTYLLPADSGHATADSGHSAECALGRSLSPVERAWLEAWALPGPRHGALALRACLILLSQEHSVPATARQLGLSIAQVTAWCARFRAGGLQALRPN